MNPHLIPNNTDYRKGFVEQEDQNESGRVLLDGNFLDYTTGFPLPLEDLSKHTLHKAIHNDTLFLSKSEIVDYSILCGICDETNEIVVGIIGKACHVKIVIKFKFLLPPHVCYTWGGSKILNYCTNSSVR